MVSYERNPDQLGMKPTWEGNLCLLLLVAMIVSGSIFAFVTK